MVEHSGAEVVSLMPTSPNTIAVPLNTTGSPEVWPGASTHITFNDLSYSVRPKSKGKRPKEILVGVNGYFRGGCLNVIIGPSGAGKTTLLSILCGVKGKDSVRGDVRINGTVGSQEVLRKSACYIPQEFELLPALTTRETLYFSARLKIPRTNESYINGLVEEIATKLGLTYCLGTMAGNLSGGERKRLSIGIEIVVNPMVLVLDEPTSGLDSAASIQVVTQLKNIANTGCTVVCSIHQPSSQMITIFDEILVLADGRDFYCGPRNKIVSTFEEAKFSCPPFYNICEYVIEVVTGQHDGDLDLLRSCGKKYKLRETDRSNLLCESERKDAKLPFSTRIKNIGRAGQNYCYNWQNEFLVLTHRSVKCILRDNMGTKVRLAVHILVGLFLGTVFYNFGNEGSQVFSNVSCLFFCLLFLFFGQAMPAMQIFPVEAAVFKREHSNNWYGLMPYYLSKLITDLPLQFLCPTSFLAIVYFMTGQPADYDRFTKCWLICFLLCMLAQSFGILTGAVVNTYLGSFFVPALNIPMSIFAGFFLKFTEIPFYMLPFAYVSYFRYAFEGVMQAIYGNGRSALNCSEAFCIFKRPEKILQEMNMPSIDFSTAVYALIAWIAFLQICIYIVLKWKFIRTSL